MKGVVALGILLIGIVDAYGATFVSKQEGSWMNMSTWKTIEKYVDHFTPQAGDDVVVEHNVYFASKNPCEVNSVTVRGKYGLLYIGKTVDDKAVCVDLKIAKLVNQSVVWCEPGASGSKLEIGRLENKVEAYICNLGFNGGRIVVGDVINESPGQLNLLCASEITIDHVDNTGNMYVDRTIDLDTYSVKIGTLENSGLIGLKHKCDVLEISGNAQLGTIWQSTNQGRVEMHGSKRQKITGGEVKVMNLVIDNENGVESEANIEVTGKLTLKRGVLKIVDDKSIYLSKEKYEEQLDATMCGDACHVDGLMYRYLYIRTLEEKAEVFYPVGNDGKYGCILLGSGSNMSKVGVRYRRDTAKKYRGSEDEKLWASLGNEHWEITGGGKSTYMSVKFTDESDVDIEGSRMALYKNGEWKAIDEEDVAHEEDGRWRYKPAMDGCEAVVALANVEKRYWIGRNDDYYDSSNWPNGERNRDMYIQDGCEHYPIIKRGDNVKIDNLSIYGHKAKVTLDGGTLDVASRVRVGDMLGEGHVAIKNRYDWSSAFRCGETDYKRFVVERTFPTNVVYYTGSATKESTFVGDIEIEDSRVSEGMVNLNHRGYDYLSVYNPEKCEFEDSDNLMMGDNYCVAALGLVRVNGKSERKIRQVGTLYGTEDGDNGIFKMKESNTGENWNLIVNPYMYKIPIEKLEFGSGVEKTIWVRHCNIETKKYLFSTYNKEAGIGVSQGDGAELAYLAPQQSFYALRKNNVDDQDATIRYMAVDQIDGGGLKSEKKQSVVMLRMNTEDGASDEMAIIIRDEDIACDSRKNEETQGDQIYATKEDGKRYAIPFVNISTDEVKEVKIGLNLARNEKANIEMTVDEDIPYDIRLIDKETGEMEDGVCVIEGEGVIEDRLMVVIARKNDDIASGMKNDGGIAVAVKGRELKVVKEDGKDLMMRVYDMAGRLVVKRRLENSETNVTLGRKSVYIVEITTDGVMIRRKIRTK